jgi:hypothetical protein
MAAVWRKTQATSLEFERKTLGISFTVKVNPVQTEPSVKRVKATRF